jgi:glycosyltransferase involved in cell wall biosynthesis
MTKVGILVEQLRQKVPGGIGTYILGLAKGLGELDAPNLQTVAIASKQTGSEPPFNLELPIVTTSFSHRLQMLLWDRGIAAPSLDLDVLHLTSLAGPLTRKNVPARTVMVHDLSWRHFPELTTPRGVRWHEAAFERVINSSAHVLVTSNFVAREVEGAGISSKRIAVVRAGSDHLAAADDVGAERLLEEMGIDGPFILSVSTLEPRKNLARLIEAYGQVRSTVGDHVPLVIVGPKGWGPSIAPAPGVHFAGHLAEAVLAGLYKRATIFAYVPLHEGFGLPPLEAMASSLPTVVSTVTPSVESTDACWKVDPTNVDAIVDALSEALGNEAQRAEVGAAGKRFADGYRWVDVAQAHVDVWTSL